LAEIYRFANCARGVRQTTVDIDAKSKDATFWFRVTGSVLKFDGFLKVYEESKEGKDDDDAGTEA